METQFRMAIASSLQFGPAGGYIRTSHLACTKRQRTFSQNKKQRRETERKKKNKRRQVGPFLFSRCNPPKSRPQHPQSALRRVTALLRRAAAVTFTDPTVFEKGGKMREVAFRCYGKNPNHKTRPRFLSRLMFRDEGLKRHARGCLTCVMSCCCFDGKPRIGLARWV